MKNNILSNAIIVVSSIFIFICIVILVKLGKSEEMLALEVGSSTPVYKQNYDMSDDTWTIEYEEKVFKPYCVGDIKKVDNELIGYVKEHNNISKYIFKVKDQSVDDFIITISDNVLNHVSGSNIGFIYKNVNLSDIPYGIDKSDITEDDINVGTIKNIEINNSISEYLQYEDNVNGYDYLVYNDKKYVPFCKAKAYYTTDMVGYIQNRKNIEKVIYKFLDYPEDEWIIVVSCHACEYLNEENVEYVMREVHVREYPKELKPDLSLSCNEEFK